MEIEFNISTKLRVIKGFSNKKISFKKELDILEKDRIVIQDIKNGVIWLSDDERILGCPTRHYKKI